MTDDVSIVYFVRHAHAIWTPDEDRPLSARGFADATRVAQALINVPVAAVYASSARRAQQTVEPLAAQCCLEIEVCHDMRERVVAAQPVDDFDAAMAWLWANPAQSLPGGESNETAQARGVAALQSVLQRHRGQQCVIGSHGNMLALLLQYVDPSVDRAFWEAMTMPDIYRLTWRWNGSSSFRRWWVPQV